MIGQLASFPYLGTSLLLWLAALACIIAWTRQRRSLWLIALLGAPFGIYSFEFIPQYWDPHVVLWLGACSLEDLLFSTSTGVIAWTLAAAGWLRVRRPAPGWVGRFGLIYALGVGVGYILKYTLPDPNVMNSTMAGIAVSAAVMLALRPGLWPLVLRGAALFGVFYLAFIKLALLLYPGFLASWSPDVPFGYWWGIPLYELYWAVAFGAVWPLFIAFSFGWRLHYRAKLGGGGQG